MKLKEIIEKMKNRITTRLVEEVNFDSDGLQAMSHVIDTIDFSDLEKIQQEQEAQEALIKEMMKYIELMSNDRYYCKKCSVAFCSDKTYCEQNKLKEIIQKAKETLNETNE